MKKKKNFLPSHMRGAFFFPLDTSVWYSVSQLKNGEFTNKRESFRCGSIDFRCNRAPVATKWNVLPEYKYIYLHIHAYIVMYAWTNTWALNTMAEDLRSQFFFFFFSIIMTIDLTIQDRWKKSIVSAIVLRDTYAPASGH